MVESGKNESKGKIASNGAGPLTLLAISIAFCGLSLTMGFVLMTFGVRLKPEPGPLDEVLALAPWILFVFAFVWFLMGGYQLQRAKIIGKSP